VTEHKVFYALFIEVGCQTHDVDQKNHVHRVLGQAGNFFGWIPPTRHDNLSNSVSWNPEQVAAHDREKKASWCFCTTTPAHTPRHEHVSCLLHSNGNWWIIPLTNFVCSCTWRDVLPVRRSTATMSGRKALRSGSRLFDGRLLWTGHKKPCVPLRQVLQCGWRLCRRVDYGTQNLITMNNNIIHQVKYIFIAKHYLHSGCAS
jgi:hypothetical protein